MHIEQRLVGNVVIIDVSGQVLGSDDQPLTDKIRSLREQGYRSVVVDLGKVPYMDSAGLGDLVQAYATMTKAGGRLALLRPAGRLRDLLTITKLLTVFDCYDEETAALSSCAEPAVRTAAPGRP
jgi:anti-sigma B factor antagonist